MVLQSDLIIIVNSPVVGVDAEIDESQTVVHVSVPAALQGAQILVLLIGRESCGG